MLVRYATGCFCAGQGQSGACLFKMVRKALLKNDQSSSTDGVRLIAFQDTLLAISAVDCNSTPFSSSILVENVVVGDGNV